MKKYLALLLCLVMALSLVACGEKEEAPAPDPAPEQSDGGEVAQPSAADVFPERDIALELGYAAGAGADLTSRAVMPFVEDILGCNIVISYNPGSGGELSFTKLALNTPNDGYNWAWYCLPNAAVFPIQSDACEYSNDQLMPVCQISYDPCSFVVREDSPFQTLQDLMDYAKEHPGELTISHSGVGGDDFLANVTFMQKTGLELTQVAYSNGSGEAIPALLGGHIDVATFNATEFSQYEGLRMLGVMDTERCSVVPDVPTFAEQGVDLVMITNRGFAVPAGTDKAIVDKIAAAVEETLSNPEFLKKAEDLKLLIDYKGPDEFAELVKTFEKDVQATYDANPW